MTLIESLQAELQDMKDGKRRFPYDLSTEVLEAMNEDLDEGWEKMRVRHELTIREHGRSLVAIPMEDENGQPVMRDGKQVPEFVYTMGQGRKGHPEVLCFYPSMTIGNALNILCDKMEAGETVTEDGIIKVSGCFGTPELKFLLLPLEGAPRKLAADKYACQCEDDEPLMLAIAPSPDGTYRQEYIPNGFLA